MYKIKHTHTRSISTGSTDMTSK